MWNLKTNTNKPTYKTEINSDTENKLTGTKEERRGHINQDYGINRYKLA